MGAAGNRHANGAKGIGNGLAVGEGFHHLLSWLYMDAFAEPMKAACKEKGIEFKGCFDCQGFLAESMHGPVQKVARNYQLDKKEL